MTRRRANTLLILLGCLYLLVIGMAIVLTLRDRTRPSVFIEPVAFCPVPGVAIQAREDDAPIPYMVPCIHLSRQQNI